MGGSDSEGYKVEKKLSLGGGWVVGTGQWYEGKGRYSYCIQPEIELDGQKGKYDKMPHFW